MATLTERRCVLARRQALACTNRDGLSRAYITRPSFALVMSVSAAQEWHPVEDVLLEPFEPEVDHRCNKKCNQLREDQAPDND